MLKKRQTLLYALFATVLLVHAALSIGAHGLKARWLNVPPVPDEKGVAAFALGDRQFAYRTTGLMLQNLGNTGGHSKSLTDYNYSGLGGWLHLADKLDPQSNYVPLLAAYYFGATKKADDLTPVIDYLAAVGQRPEGEKWRWLAQAVFLARYQQGDIDKALMLAEKLAAQWREGRPAWMKQMPAFILTAQGDKAAAYDIMISVLRQEADKMHPMEVKFMVDYICGKLLDPAQAAQNSLCAEQKEG